MMGLRVVASPRPDHFFFNLAALACSSSFFASSSVYSRKTSRPLTATFEASWILRPLPSPCGHADPTRVQNGFSSLPS